jgi:hypothetical protein
MLKVSLLFVLLLAGMMQAQIPVEIFIGHQKATVDIMFFKNIHSNKNTNSPWLFFNRNRANMDYRMTSSSNLPQFGFTEAISFNPKSWRGLAPVWVGQILTTGVFSKAGIQLAKVKKNMTLFSWVVCETKNEPVLDYFILVRATPRLSDKINLFSQFESINSFPSTNETYYSFSQRLRLGLKLNSLQAGVGLDFNQTGRVNYICTQNLGGFIRYEF